MSGQVRMKLMQLPLQLEHCQGRDLIPLGDLYARVRRLTASFQSFNPAKCSLEGALEQ